MRNQRVSHAMDTHAAAPAPRTHKYASAVKLPNESGMVPDSELPFSSLHAAGSARGEGLAAASSAVQRRPVAATHSRVSATKLPMLEGKVPLKEFN
jgi:hypothetical protein